jgi:NADP-dependent 3-hydroxy acid dehydrogenase YdfG
MIVMTGASCGIGADSHANLPRKRPRLVLAARSAEGLDAAAAGCRARGERALMQASDATDDAQSRAPVDRAVAGLGALDVLVDNAGGSMNAWFAAMRARRREFMMTARGEFGLLLKLLVPGVVDQMALAAPDKRDGGRR